MLLQLLVHIGMLLKSTQKILELGMDWGRLMHCKGCINTLCIILVEQLSPGQKIQECGMLWRNAMIRWIRRMNLSNVMKGQMLVRIKRELQFIS